MSAVWQLLQDGRFEEACSTADREYSETQSLLALRNKVYALLRLDRNREAAILCDDIIGLDGGNSDSDYISLGVAQWRDGRRIEAVATWQLASDTKHTDAAGGVDVWLLCYFAAVKLADKTLMNRSESKLKSIGKRRSIANWPGAVALFILGKLTEDELLATRSEQPLLRARQLCKAEFYIGVMRLISGDLAGYRVHMHRSLSYGAVCPLGPEYYLADVESRSL